MPTTEVSGSFRPSAFIQHRSQVFLTNACPFIHDFSILYYYDFYENNSFVSCYFRLVGLLVLNISSRQH